MITILICLVLGIIIPCIICYRVSGDLYYVGPGIAVGLIFGMIVGAVIAFALPGETRFKKDTYAIESMQDGSNISGHFFLGSGSIGEEMKYTFYYQTKNGGYKMKQVNHEDAEIFYSSAAPKAIYLTKEYTDSWVNWFALERGIACGCSGKWEIYIPEGSIKHEYNLDAE